MVEATGLEPAASCSQSRHSTKLSYASMVQKATHIKPFLTVNNYICLYWICQVFFEKNAVKKALAIRIRI